MEPVRIRNTAIGEGIPKLCIPITGNNPEQVKRDAESVVRLRADIAEWRADYFAHIPEPSETAEILRELREILGDIPLIVTMRTSEEGGCKTLADDEYADFNLNAARSGMADMIDIEAYRTVKAPDGARDNKRNHSRSASEKLIKELHQTGVKVIASYHDFNGTPAEEEMTERLLEMEAMGGDILKLAVMPHSQEDVLALLGATCKSGRTAQSPVVTVAMSELGVISRIAGEVFGSAVTFGAGEEASAPGQPAAEELRTALQIFHRAINTR